MDNSKFEKAATVCWATVRDLTDINRQLLGIETREWLYYNIEQTIEAARLCAEEGAAESANVRPAMLCADRCFNTIDCIKYYDQSDDTIVKVKDICSLCMKACKTLLSYGGV